MLLVAHAWRAAPACPWTGTAIALDEIAPAGGLDMKLESLEMDGVMHRKPLTCQPNDPLSAPSQLMWDHGVGSIAVVNEDGAPVGMITDRDIAMCAHLNGLPLSALRVSRAMSATVVTVRRNNTVAQAQHLMRSYRLHRLPVVDEHGLLVGIFGVSDLARHIQDLPSPTQDDAMLLLALVSELGRPRVEPAPRVQAG
jgi:CBS domain-containing protein